MYWSVEQKTKKPRQHPVREFYFFDTNTMFQAASFIYACEWHTHKMLAEDFKQGELPPFSVDTIRLSIKL